MYYGILYYSEKSDNIMCAYMKGYLRCIIRFKSKLQNFMNIDVCICVHVYVHVNLKSCHLSKIKVQ